ncbi:MAG: hypothetical protein Q4A98_10595 [Comamonadaceae bacterium]|nr:hypothetical protein [Comamonadaceae bacterium]
MTGFFPLPEKFVFFSIHLPSASAALLLIALALHSQWKAIGRAALCALAYAGYALLMLALDAPLALAALILAAPWALNIVLVFFAIYCRKTARK